MNGLMDWICRKPPPSTPESIALEQVMDKIWLEVLASADLTRPTALTVRVTRVRRTWRGKRFSYVTGWRVVLKQVDPYCR